jgi:hypothetical protein
MAATKYDFTIEQGSSFEFILTYKTPENNPVNLTGRCARLAWRTNKRELYSFFTDNTDLENYKFIIIDEANKFFNINEKY